MWDDFTDDGGYNDSFNSETAEIAVFSDNSDPEVLPRSLHVYAMCLLVLTVMICVFAYFVDFEWALLMQAISDA